MKNLELPAPDWYVNQCYLYPKDPRGWRATLLRLHDKLDPNRNDRRDFWRDVFPEIDDEDCIPQIISSPTVEVINCAEEAGQELQSIHQALLLRIHLGAPDGTIIDEFEKKLLEARRIHPAPIQRRGRRALNAIPRIISSPTVEVINYTEETSRKLHSIERPSLCLRIHLGAPDGTIIKEVRKKLLKARETHPAPVQRPGKPAMNAIIEEKHFKLWKQYKIIDLAELRAWKMQENQQKISKAQIGRWIYQDPKLDPKKTLEKAERILNYALKNIRALDMQIVAAHNGL